ncbi:Type IV secretion system protein virB1 [Paraburkholderia aspalathi]|uniref:lytic transglycosylase domain-containing protein n=1 Tax=Paraburkholderia aspalathi TaxID=1324617 RepID=UPI001B1D232F|nr:lytic transglycosylase domain-containing protein [Paraburkholderia aspalathi]CAE6825263.1 Type IV secretion system protein virB1 [Paraburkholderia aspalathi]
MLIDFMAIAQQCAPQIDPITMAALVRTESGFNPFAIGVVHGRLLRQPSNWVEAIATMRALEAAGWNFSVGLAQVNHANWRAYGLTEQNAFEPCRNVAVGAAILQRCFMFAHRAQADTQVALRASLSCYGSGDFSTGYRTGYVQRVVKNAQQPVPTFPITVPSIAPIPVLPVDSRMSANPIRPYPVARRPLLPDRDDALTDEQGGEPGSSAVVF